MTVNPEKEALFERARGALHDYKQTDQRVAVGALTLDRCVYLIGDAEAGAEGLTVNEQHDLAWLQFEHAMAVLNGPHEGVKDIVHVQGARKLVERSRTTFRGIVRNQHAAPAMRAQARYELDSLALYEAVCAQKIMVSPGDRRRYTDTVLEIASNYQEYFSPEDAQAAHVLTTIALLGDATNADSYAGILILPAPTRVDWHINAHYSHTQPAKHIFVTDGSDEISDDTVLILHDDLMTTWKDEDDFGPFPTLGAYAECRTMYNIHRNTKRSGNRMSAALQRCREIQPQLFGLAESLEDRYVGAEQPEVIVPRIFKPETAIEHRDILPEISWYLADYTGEMDDVFIANLRRIEAHRSEEGLLPEEQRALGWMQYEYARTIAASDDAQSRKAFASAIDTFERATKGFTAARRYGDASDSLLAGEAMEVYRALHTSSNRRVPSKEAARYAASVGELFAKARSDIARTKGDPEQSALLVKNVKLATLAMLQATSKDETMRHAVLPAPMHIKVDGRPVDGIGYLLVQGDKFYEFDMEAPVTLALAEGDSHKVTGGHVVVGFDVFSPNDPLALLDTLVASTVQSGKTKGKHTASVKQTADQEDLVAVMSDNLFEASEARV